MPFFISPNTFKKQAKTLVKYWPRHALRTSQARAVLSQMYGYRNDHHYQKCCDQSGANGVSITPEVVSVHFPSWVRLLAGFGGVNEIQAKQLLERLWPAYMASLTALSKKWYRASLQFHGECRDFLNAELVMMPINYAFDDHPAVKDAIEACGIPHTEIGAIKVGLNWVGLDYRLNDGDELHIYDHSLTETSYPLPYLPKGERVFLLDVHLGGLARYLRMAGFNCLYEERDRGDAFLAEAAACGDYILLTRDIGLLKRSKVTFGRWIRNVDPEKQFLEVMTHYHLQEDFKPFSRCVKCNGLIRPVEKQAIKAQVPERVFQSHEHFQQCDSCQQIYWQGTHYQKMVMKLNTLMSNPAVK